MSQSHIFALFSQQPLAQELTSGDIFQVRDAELWSRIVHILRLSVGESVILFDQNAHVTIKLLSETFGRKGLIEGTVVSLQKNQQVLPEVHLYPCLLRKEAFEEVIYVAAQMGVTSITPVISEKIQRKWGGEKEIERLGKIMISACEQSKNFVLPQCNQPLMFDKVVSQKFMTGTISKSIAFYEGGKPLINLVHELSTQKQKSINLMFGTEGGFSEQELKMLQSGDVQLYALTPTILRAKEAITVGVGIVRSITS